MLSFNPAECQQRQIYKLMTGIIVPRPVALHHPPGMPVAPRDLHYNASVVP